MDKTALKNEASAWMDERREPMVDLLCEVLECDTTNPPGNEERAAKVVRRFLRERDIAWEEHAAKPDRPNILAEVGSGQSPRLLVAAHLDVVPAGPGWTGDPFKPRREDGRVVARGATDNKAAIPGLLEAAAWLKRHESRMKGTLVVGAVADEERGSADGFKYLIAEKLVKADMALIPDNSGGLVDMAVGEKGLLEVDVRAYGKAAHASRPDAGVSAVWAMHAFLQRVRGYALPGTPHPLFSPPTLNVGTLRGGHASNIVPDLCEANLNIRYLPGTTAQEILDDLAGLARQAAAEVPGSRVEVHMTEDQPAWVLDQEAGSSLTAAKTGLSLSAAKTGWLDAVKENARAVTGKDVIPGGLSGTTVAKLLYFAGIPSINFGPGAHDAPHVADEWVDVDQVVDFGKILAGVCVDLLF